MRLPPDIIQKLLAGSSLGFGCDEAGVVLDWPASDDIYPPVGYLRWDVLEVGNGDTYGYYWPVGQEDQEPIVCTTEHDAFRLVPFASNLAGCLRRLCATEPEMVDEVREVAQKFAISLVGVRLGSASTAAQALAVLDSRSPQLLLAVAREAMRRGDLARGEQYCIQALNLLPEYGEGAFVLSQFYRRQQRFAEAARGLLMAISSPLCFSGGNEIRVKCLRGLQGMKDEVFTGDDVLWHERRHLTFQTSVKQNDDFRIYDEAIEAYLSAGNGTQAIWLRMLVGELLSLETVSFQERHEWTRATQHQNLRRDLIRAGLASRVAALDASYE